MITKEFLLLLHGKDKTVSAETCLWDENLQRYQVTFTGNSKVYSYGKASVLYIEHPKPSSPKEIQITDAAGKRLLHIKEILVFYNGEAEYWRVYFEDGREKLYERNTLCVCENCLIETDAKKCMEYLRELAKNSEL